jgi:hypothetical protein
MNTLQLTDEQTELLRRILNSTISDLGMEIADTDSMDFREGLKRDKQLALEMLASLENAPAA